MLRGMKEAWHRIGTEEAARRLETDPRRGLSADEVRRRLATQGPNRIRSRPGTPAWKRFLLQFAQPLTYILLLAACVTGFLGVWVDSAVIALVVVVNAIVGFLQESKAEKAIEALGNLVMTEATVRRDGTQRRVPSEDLVPGDVVLLQSGDRVPADLRLSRVRSLQVDESALTGESVPVAKHADPLEEDKLGRLALTHDGLIERDMLVMELCRRRGWPVSIAIGGGYADPIEASVRGYANTFRTAREVFGF